MNFSCSLMVFWINSVDPRVFFSRGVDKRASRKKRLRKKKEEKEKAQLHGTIDSFDFFWLVCVMKKFAAGFFRWFLAGGWQERKGKRKEERCEQVKKEKKKRTKKKRIERDSDPPCCLYCLPTLPANPSQLGGPSSTHCVCAGVDPEPGVWRVKFGKETKKTRLCCMDTLWDANLLARKQEKKSGIAISLDCKPVKERSRGSTLT